MANYMVQTMRSGVIRQTTYYRKQSQPHVTHEESGAFTAAAKTAYANANGILPAAVEVGAFRSNQGVPNPGTPI